MMATIYYTNATRNPTSLIAISELTQHEANPLTSNKRHFTWNDMSYEINVHHVGYNENVNAIIDSVCNNGS